MEFLVITNLKNIFILIFVSLLLNCFIDIRSVAQILPEEEVKALEAISVKLGIDFWKIDPSFCNRTGELLNVTVEDKIERNVTCNCTNNVCHVTNIFLKGQNLTGLLPVEFSNLSHLQQIELALNCISGSIPTSFAKLPLTNLSLYGNRISGSIPEELGDVATLKELVLAYNQLGGPLPQKLGNLSRLSRLVLSGNNFTGTIPKTYGNLKKLTDFRIDGNTLSGKIPDFIGNWTTIGRLDMQGTSMEGPIPPTISQLKNLTELRISDLKGTTIDFPNLLDMIYIKTLILRNCSITGSIPPYIGGLPKLKTLDLSFNRLTGQILMSIQSAIQKSGLDHLFLASNSLSGGFPSWVLTDNNNNKIDISYNNFTGSSPSDACQMSSVNVVSSVSSAESNSTYQWCLKKDLPCPRKPQYHSLFINCGGSSETTFEGKEYEKDVAEGGASSYFHAPSDKWAFSSTGIFMDNTNGAKYKAKLNTGAGLYETARLAPTSLKYYGLCLHKGSYKVRLHFAEIMFSDDQTFSSLGKRIFDVSIQGNVVLKDFNIMEEAKGVGIGIVKEFDTLVNGSTLEIHLYWSGKGTTAIPNGGVYGPLLSAIAVTPNFDVHTGLSVGPIVGIVVASCVVLVLTLVVLWRKGYLGGKDLEDRELRALELQTGYFTLRQIKAATRNQLLLIYEYMENNSLARALFGKHQLNLDWPTRKKICIGIARGLAYLHEESRLKIVHRDIKATNVLLDKELNAKISDFGLAKLDEEENTHISTRIAGTMPKEDFVYLLDWAYVLQEQGNLLELVDPILGTNYSEEEATTMLKLALLCTNPSPTLRPAMSSVVSMLEGKSPVQAPIIKRSALNEDMRFKAFGKLSQDSQIHVSTFSEGSLLQRSVSSMDVPWIDSSVYGHSKNEAGDHSPSSKLLSDLYEDGRKFLTEFGSSPLDFLDSLNAPLNVLLYIR
ncbi:hypothetical protein F0562_009027 [Nyssa sinensis]|uniref:non-specific serine/threonine protein kinase n=1 Tax=Nyssa sinensis TaxID=561372 RepID=A0A5J5A776_9ASTE|nr:hypothetical protein F0562_009027 [Nyssa sinensis]